MISAPTLRTTVGRWLRQQLGDAFVRGSGLQLSDLARVAIRLVRNRWPADQGEPPRPNQPVRISRVELIESLLSADADLLAAVVDDAGRLIEAVAARLPAGRPARRRTAIGALAVTAAGSHAIQHGRRLEPAAFEALADRLAGELRDPVGKLPRRQFADAYAAMYDRLWADRGAATLGEHPPSSLALGHDQQPLLVSAPHLAAEGGWFAGTDRSVYGRYALHFNPNARSRPRKSSHPATDPADGPDRECAAEPERPHPQAAELELRRACEPYGLAEPEHRLILRSLHHGATLPARPTEPQRAEARARWRAWRSADTTHGLGSDGPEALDEEELTSAVTAFALNWSTDRSAGRETVGNVTDLDMRSGEVTRAVVRKAWMDLLRAERESVELHGRASIARLIQVAFDQGIPRGLSHWAAAPEPVPDERRLNNTLALLRRIRSLGELISADLSAPGWRASYEAAIRRQVGAAAGEIYLTADELLEHLGAHLAPAEDGA